MNLKALSSKAINSLFIIAIFLAKLTLAADEVQEAKSELARIVKITETIAPYVEQLDEARLIVIRKSAERVLTHVNSLGLGNFQTLSAYQQLIITYRFSVSFFKQIATSNSEKLVVELVAIGAKIEKERGFDDSPYTRITANVFSQQYQLFLQLRESTTLPNETKEKINALIAPLAKVIAVAKQGDRPKTFEAAYPVHEAIRELYPAFFEIQRGNAAFDVVMEIMGLHDFYAEFAQINGIEN